MMKHRLVSTASALALALAQVTPALSLTPSQVIQQNTTPVPNPDGYSVQQMQRLSAPALGGGTTVGGGLILSHVANMAGVASLINTGQPVEVDGTTVAGDGGRRRMTFDSANLCGSAGHPAADGGTCVNSTVVTTGSWNIDWGSVNFTATPQLFPRGSDDTSRIQAALSTGMHVHFPHVGAAASTFYDVSKDLVLTTPYQVIDGDGRDAVFVRADGASNFSRGVFVGGVYNPANPTATIMNSQRLRDFTVLANQNPTPSKSSDLYNFPPMFNFEENTSWKMERMGCYQAMVCVDAQGNDGDAAILDFAFSAFTTGIQIDGSADRFKMRDLSWGPKTMSSAQQTLFYASSTGITAGRVDGFDLVGGVFFGGQAIKFFDGTRSGAEAGPPFGNIASVDFDNYNGILMQTTSGTISCASCTFTAGAGQTPIVQTGGNLNLAGGNIGNGRTASNGLVTVSGGVFAASAVTFDTTNTDTRAISGNGGVIILSGDTFLRDSSVKNYAADTVYSNGSILIMQGNYATGYNVNSTGSASFVNSVTDINNRVVGNLAPGWTYKVAGAAAPNSLGGTSGGGVYAGN